MIVQHKLTQITLVDFDEFCPKIMSILCLKSYYMKKNQKESDDIWNWKLKVSESQIKKNLSKKSATSWLMSSKHMLKHCVLKWKKT